MSVAFKRSSRPTPAERYRKCREYAMAFWEHVSEVALIEGFDRGELDRFVGQVSGALRSIQPAMERQRRG